MTSSRVAPAVVASGHTMALAVVRSLGEAGVPVAVAHYDERDMAHASRYVVADIRVPDPVREEDGFVDALLAVGRRFAGAVLIPASDESTVAVSRNRDALAERYIVACPPWEVAELFIDKTRTYELAVVAGVPVPRTLVPRGPEDLESLAGQVGFPLLLKPAESHLFYLRFGRKMFRVGSLPELADLYGRARDAGLSMTLQEIVPGPDSSVVNYNAYAVEGRSLVEFTARQLRKAPPAFGSPRVVVSERIPGVVEPGRRILSAMGLSGFACVEFKLDERDGTYKLIEVNGRHNLSGMLAIRCGIDFPMIQYRHLVDGVVPSGGVYRVGTYWTDVLRDVGYSLAFLRRERYTAPQYLRPYARRHCDAILDRHDMGPFWTRLRYGLGHAGSLARRTSPR